MPANSSIFLSPIGLLAGCLLMAACDSKRCATQEATAPRHAPTPNGPDWPVTRGGGGLQGRIHAPAPRHPVVEWTLAGNAAITSEAAIAHGLIVFGDEAGIVHAVDLASHQPVWQLTTGDTVEATPAITAQQVFIGSNDGTFRALDRTTGRTLWQLKSREKFPTGAVVIAAPDGLPEGNILVNGYDGTARCLRANDGTPVWSYASADYINGSPALLDGGLIAFGGCDAMLHLIHLNDGSQLRELTTDAQIVRSVAAADDMIYGVNYADQLIAAAVTADQLKWIYQDDGAQFLTSPGLDDERVYVGARDKHLHAVWRKDGTRAWKFQTGGRVASAPLVFDDAVVFGSADGRLYALDPQTGRELWRLDLGEKLAAAPAFAAGRIIIGGGDGSLFVIREGGNP